MDGLRGICLLLPLVVASVCYGERAGGRNYCRIGSPTTYSAPECASCRYTYSAAPPTEWLNAPIPAVEIPSRAAERVPQTISLAETLETALANNKEITVSNYLPDEIGTTIDTSLAVFDPFIGVNLMGGTSYNQIRSYIETEGALSPDQRSEILRPDSLSTLVPSPIVPNQLYWAKRFRYGGIVELGFGTDYLNEDPVGGLAFKNPSWRSALNLRVEQPLCKGRGRAVNEAPIAIARANLQESLYAFRTRVSALSLNVEITYWNLVMTRSNQDIRRQAMALAAKTLEMERERLRIGEGSVPDLAQAEEQYELFRADYLQSLSDIATVEYELRRLMGLPAADQYELVPADVPNADDAQPEWQAAVHTAMSRPELLAQCAAIRAAKLDLFRQQNGLQPDIAATFDVAVTGLEREFGTSVDTLTDFRYSNWTVGLAYRRPIHYRAERAAVRRAQLALGRSRAQLAAIEHDIFHQLGTAYQRLIASQRVHEAQQRRLLAAQTQLEARQELYLQRRCTLDEQVRAEARYVEAKLRTNDTLLRCQQALAQWLYAAGTLLDGRIVVEEDETLLDDK